MATVKMSIRVRYLALLYHMRFNGAYHATTTEQGLLINRARKRKHVEWIDSKWGRVVQLTQEGKDFVDDAIEASMSY